MHNTIAEETVQYNGSQTAEDQAICDTLASAIAEGLPDATNKIWHGHPVWFLDGNPIVGYSKEKRGIRLMFWSGADFGEDGLAIRGIKFKDASVFYQVSSEVDLPALARWLRKARDIQWDYKNLVKRKGRLERLKYPIFN